MTLVLSVKLGIDFCYVNQLRGPMEEHFEISAESLKLDVERMTLATPHDRNLQHVKARSMSSFVVEKMKWDTCRSPNTSVPHGCGGEESPSAPLAGQGAILTTRADLEHCDSFDSTVDSSVSSSTDYAIAPQYPLGSHVRMTGDKVKPVDVSVEVAMPVQIDDGHGPHKSTVNDLGTEDHMVGENEGRVKDFDAFMADYELGEVLGHGGFGYVRNAMRKSDGKGVAVKVLLAKNVQFWSEDVSLGNIPTEVFVLKMLKSGSQEVKKFINRKTRDPESQDTTGIQCHHCTSLRETGSVGNIASGGSEQALNSSGLDGTIGDSGIGLDSASSSSSCFPSKIISSMHGSVPSIALQQSFCTCSLFRDVVGLGKDSEKGENNNRQFALRGVDKVIEFIDLYEYNDVFLLVMEKMTNTIDLFEYIERNPNMGEPKANHIFRQVADGICFCHSMGVYHRDIKDENVLMDEETCEAKLIDFGSASFMDPQFHTVFRGTKEYAAPEVLLGKKYLGESSEVWSLGILLFTLVFGVNPFLDEKETIMGKYEYPVECSAELKHLIKSMLCVSASKRPSMNDILNHPWVKIQDTAYSIWKTIDSIIEEDGDELGSLTKKLASSNRQLTGSEHVKSVKDRMNSQAEKQRMAVNTFSMPSRRLLSSSSESSDDGDAELVDEKPFYGNEGCSNHIPDSPFTAFQRFTRLGRYLNPLEAKKAVDEQVDG